MRVLEEPAFVLHSIAYKETSLILDVFTRHYGRIALVAKGAKRPHSALRPVLQQFQPLHIHFSGKLELKTLTKSEWTGGVVPLAGDALLCGFYMNELIVKFLAREDEHESLFDDYHQTIAQLSVAKDQFEKILRPFEIRLLQETGADLDPELDYVYQPEVGVRPHGLSDPLFWPILKGKHFSALAKFYLEDPETLQLSKPLMRFLLGLHLQDQVLTTRQILIELKKL